MKLPSPPKALICASIVVGILAAIAMAVTILSQGRNPPIGAVIFVSAVMGFGAASTFAMAGYKLISYVWAIEETARVGRKILDGPDHHADDEISD
jgi:hypothetical protein